jgi:hypothetical protein
MLVSTSAPRRERRQRQIVDIGGERALRRSHLFANFYSAPHSLLYDTRNSTAEIAGT